MVKNIMVAGVGGQGLVLTTAIISDAAFRAGFDVKTNDVIGLSQRGGKIWGSVRYSDSTSEPVFSPNIPPKSADVLIALEPLEGYRWSGIIRDGGTLLLNLAKIPPVPVIAEKIPYPENLGRTMRDAGRFRVIEIQALEEARSLGNIRVVNTILIGMLAAIQTDIEKSFWRASIETNVPKKTVEVNLKAFDLGYNWLEQTEQ